MATPTPKLDIGELRKGLKKVGFRAFAAVQKQMDIAQFFNTGAVLANEKDFLELRAEAKFAASESTALSFERTKFEAQRWFLKNSLLETLRIIAVVLEDIRTICALASHVDKTGEELQSVSKEITGKTRQAFSRLPLEAQLDTLEKEHEVKSPYRESVESFVALAKCLSLRNGVVGKADAPKGDGLVLRFHGLQVQAGEGASINPGQADLKLKPSLATKVIGLDQPIDLSRQENLAVFLSMCLFLSSLLQSADEMLARKAPATKKRSAKDSQ